jgi:hypothetical protein
MEFQELNSDQRREAVNTRQRYAAFREAQAQADAYRGSMIWNEIKGREYLIRSHYDKSGIRRQTSIGVRSAETERMKDAFDSGRHEADERLKNLKEIMTRQAGINRAVGLARMPLMGAKVIRALDDIGLLGSGIRVLGTNSIYAYEAASGVLIDPGLTATEDIDLLFDSRHRLTFAAAENFSDRSLLRVLQKIDRSFRKTKETFRAANRDGYLVDLIKPMRNPPWLADQTQVGSDPNDLVAVEIEGLGWHENASPFEAIAIDEKGEPLRIVTSDPRIWAAHKLWVSKRDNRDPNQRARDAAQAQLVARMVAKYLPHLPFKAEEMKMLPKEIFELARTMFEA